MSRKRQRHHNQRPAAPSVEYHCTKCGHQVEKPACSKEIGKIPATGLGKWKCSCGNKAVRRVKVEPQPPKAQAA